MASLIETCKLNKVEPFAYLSDVVSKIAEGWPMSRLDDLLPWNDLKPHSDGPRTIALMSVFKPPRAIILPFNVQRER